MTTERFRGIAATARYDTDVMHYVTINRKDTGQALSYTRNRRFVGTGPSFVTPVKMTREVAAKLLAGATNPEAWVMEVSA